MLELGPHSSPETQHPAAAQLPLKPGALLLGWSTEKPTGASGTSRWVGRGLTAKGIRAAERKDSQGASAGKAAPPALQAAADPAGQEQGQEKQHQEPEAEAAGEEQYHHHLRAAPTDGCLSSN